MDNEKGKAGSVGESGVMARVPNVFFETRGEWTEEHGELQKLCLPVQDFLIQHPGIASVVEISRGAITSSRRYGLMCSCADPAGNSGIAGATPENREVIIIARIKLDSDNKNLEHVLKKVQLTDAFMKSCRWRITSQPDLAIEIYAYKEEIMFSIGFPDNS